MLVTTRGIVLYQADYSETSLLVKIFTELGGLQSFIVKGVRKKGSRIKRNLFGPLSMVDLVAYTREARGLQTIREVSCHRQFPGISGDIRKSAVLLFMNELVYRSIPAEMPDNRLFGFLYDSVLRLEETGERIGVFPVAFALQLADMLGFMPHNNYSPALPFFDLMEGCFTQSPPQHYHYLDPGAAGVLSALLEEKYMPFEEMGHESRFLLLQKILEYFRLHLTGFGELRSHIVLSTVLRD